MSYLRFEKTLMTNLEETLPREILRTNRSGAYHCTTIVDCNTRKYHGLLVVPLPELDDENHVLLSSLDETVIQHGAEFNLGLHQYWSYQKQRQWFLTIITVQQHQAFYRQQITLTRMMGIGRILHTHKSFSYCWCERIIHKVRTVLQTYGFHHTLHTHFFFTDCQYQTRNILRRWVYFD